MKKNLLYLSMALLFISKSFAQSIGGGFMVGVPQEDFSRLNPDNGYGLNIQGMLLTPDEYSPFGVGLDFGFLIFSTENEFRPFSYAIPEVGVEVERMNSMVNAHLVFQVSPFIGRIQPYAEAYGGFSYYFTTTSIKSDYHDEVIASDVNFDDFAFSYGAGGGFKIFLTDFTSEDSESTEILLDLKVRYLAGTEAEYLTEHDVEVDQNAGIVTYFPRKSETDMLTFSIGVEFRF